jgi:hypothetical protein
MWSARCDGFSIAPVRAQSSASAPAARASKCQLPVYSSPPPVLASELSRFQYYLDCDCIWLFYCIEVYICKVLLILFNALPALARLKPTSQCTFQSFVYNLYSITHVSWSQRFSCYFFYVACLEICYNLWNLLSTWLFLLTNMRLWMTMTIWQCATTNPSACVDPTDDNLMAIPCLTCTCAELYDTQLILLLHLWCYFCCRAARFQ